MPKALFLAVLVCVLALGCAKRFSSTPGAPALPGGVIIEALPGQYLTCDPPESPVEWYAVEIDQVFFDCVGMTSHMAMWLEIPEFELGFYDLRAKACETARFGDRIQCSEWSGLYDLLIHEVPDQQARCLHGAYLLLSD